MRGRRLCLLLLAGLSACTGGHGTVAHRNALAGFVGQSRAMLLSRFGQPDDSSSDGAQSFLVWNDISAQAVQAYAGYRYENGDITGSSTAPPAYARFTCRTTFVLLNDRVVAYTLNGVGCD